MRKYYNDDENYCPSFICRGEDPTIATQAITSAGEYARWEKDETYTFGNWKECDWEDWDGKPAKYKLENVIKIFDYLDIPYHIDGEGSKKRVWLTGRDLVKACRRMFYRWDICAGGGYE